VVESIQTKGPFEREADEALKFILAFWARGFERRRPERKARPKANDIVAKSQTEKDREGRISRILK
jgi:hypothetical protein